MNLKDKIKNIARYEYMNFMRDPNVVGVGCGNKYINNIDTGKLCIRVYVKEKYKKGYNATGGIPKYYFGIPTDVIESSGFIAYSGFDEKIRPVKMGYSITALPKKYNIGTLGGVVERTDPSGNKEFFILSCNHILAGSNSLPIGTYIIQPGGSMNIANVIAKLSEFEPIKFITPGSRPENYIDAAIAKITDINIIRAQIAFMTIPKGVEYVLSINNFIKKSGAATGYSEGKVLDESGTFVITHPSGEDALFVGQILSDIRADQGDSGSMALNKDNKAIGMLCAAGKSGIIINKIERILSIMNVSLCTQQ